MRLQSILVSLKPLYTVRDMRFYYRLILLHLLVLNILRFTATSFLHSHSLQYSRKTEFDHGAGILMYFILSLMAFKYLVDSLSLRKQQIHLSVIDQTNRGQPIRRGVNHKGHPWTSFVALFQIDILVSKLSCNNEKRPMSHMISASYVCGNELSKAKKPRIESSVDALHNRYFTVV